MINQERVVSQFLEFVQINSETTQEREIADYLLALLTKLGLEVEEDDTADATGHQAGNIIAKLPATMSDAKAIYFTSHMDTVVPGTDIKPVIRDQVIYSDGTTILGADDKAGLTAIIELIHLLQEYPIPHGDIYFAIMSGEESGLAGSKLFDAKKLPAAFGYALDSDGEIGTIVVAAPAQAKIQALIKGKAAHAGVQPEKGISAISITAKAITRMPLGRIDEETTANIGSFVGKGPTNIVCDQVQLVAEARSLDSDKLNQQVSKMEEALRTAARQMGGEAEVDVAYLYPNYRFEESDEVVQVAVNAIKQMKKTPKLTVSGGGSDANNIAGKGIPTVNLAVGYRHIHTKNESIAIQDLTEIPLLMYHIVKEAVK
ncbi:M20/M25/M40 family metallo-hydrolase [Gracilibacillus alcaliphilus]|uniref:M20/M25/M40 family metallo-hydrolase n=1 Tax=Gracilibacillus alcaliphilus TaxID=1401441 RepID=UPI00195B81D6|nr:M20/M25/M40 family metallo-hydrolase [Gracilibacillus alcaliphilus]MBM7675099.1 tripeptide aminopeptidase [Gracilibacillus alcaliphilus]